jgi:pimeloyl-ACP methyl ester carboxylesterase
MNFARPRSASALTRCLLVLAFSAGCGDDSPASNHPDGSSTAEADDDAGERDAGTTPFDPPVADDCITDVNAGDHTFSCGGLTFLVMVDEKCTKQACGLIFDVHGGTMSGKQMRDNTKLHELAPPKGYLVVHPSATPEKTGGTWDLATHPPVLADFMKRMIKAFHVDESRVHVTGFSQGSGMTFWFLCNYPELLASTAPISGQSADMVTVMATGGSCLDAINASWKPRVPILFMSGTKDLALAIEPARARVTGLVDRLSLSGGEQIEGDGHYSRKRWTGADNMVLDFIEHDYGGQAVLDGHCVPGGTDLAGSENNLGANATTCSTGDIKIKWGEVALQWFIDHPKK